MRKVYENVLQVYLKNITHCGSTTTKKLSEYYQRLNSRFTLLIFTLRTKITH